jgi:hypothetical protein
LNEYELIPSGSVDADPFAVTASGADPEAGVTVNAADGGDTTETEADVVAAPPALSVTVTTNLYWPGAAYVWPTVGVAAGPMLPPSPKTKL